MKISMDEMRKTHVRTVRGARKNHGKISATLAAEVA